MGHANGGVSMASYKLLDDTESRQGANEHALHHRPSPVGIRRQELQSSCTRQDWGSQARGQHAQRAPCLDEDGCGCIGRRQVHA
eukprot:350255-Chlamydomonas_euryale.AAC.44